MARLDRLGAAAREIAQTGAAIGREFSYDLLAAVSPRGEAETGGALDRLVAAGLVFQRGAPPAAEYQFKHALVQDTAYGTLLRGPRQALHARISAAIEARAPDRAEREPEILAHHLAEAGQLERAAACWLEAGRRAAGRSANLEAIAHLRRGIDALAAPDQSRTGQELELALQLALGPAVMSTHGFGAAESAVAYRRARELALTLGDNRSLFAAVWGLWLGAGQHSAHSEREALVDELFRVAGPLDDPALRLQAHHSAWATRGWSGDLAGSREHIRQGLKLYDRREHGGHALLYGGHDPAVCGLGQGGVSLWMLGYPDQALASGREAVALGVDLAHVPSLGHGLWFAGVIHMFRRDAPAARETGERLIALGREHRLPQYRAIGEMARGWARARLGDAEDGLVEFRQGLSAYSALATVHLGFFAAALAATELHAGFPEQAGATLDEADIAIAQRGESSWRPQALQVRGDLCLTVGAPDMASAEQHYLEALAGARGQGAKSYELRAALGLARLWRAQDRARQARELVEPVYAWFTEGFDTPDLIEAKALLVSLS